ncbi:MAG: tetratricopeptide repeat protein [Bryobacteraceae bacterium]
MAAERTILTRRRGWALLAAACGALYGEVGEVQIVERVQILIQDSRLSEADQELRQAIRSYPRSGGLYNLLGIVAAEQQNTKEAEAAFLRAVTYEPGLLPALLNLARIEYVAGKREAAIEYYARALRLDNHIEEAHGNLAALFVEKGDYVEAERELAALPAAGREQNRFYALASAALAGTGKVDEARQSISKMTGAVTGQDVTIAATALAKLGRYDLVIRLLDPVAEAASAKELRALLAGAYAESGDLPQARRVWESLAEDQPKDIGPLVEAARAAYRQKDYEGSAGYLMRAIQIEPQNADAQFFLGVVCINLNLPGDALRALREAVRLKPGNAAFQFAMGAASLSAEGATSAARYFQRYVALRPADVHGHLALGVAEFENGDFAAARRELVPLTGNPGLAAGAHFILGKMYRREDDLSNAGRHFEAAVHADPSNAMLRAHLAGVYIRQNRLTEAKKELERALARDPSNYLANENLLLLLVRQKDPGAKEQQQRFAGLTQKASDDQALLFRHIELRR